MSRASVSLSLSGRARAMVPSVTVALDSRAKELLAGGVDLVNLTAGEPDFDTPRVAREAGISAINRGLTKYTPTPGTRELRAAICDKLRRENGLEYRPEQVVVSNGAKQSLYNAMMVLVDPGDEVLIPAPYWVSYPEMVRLAGGAPVLVETSARDAFKLTPEAMEAAVGPRTRGLILNNPSNPTGTVYSAGELERLAQLALEKGLFIVSDEIYEKLIYGSAKAVSIAALDPLVKRATVTVNGFSKAYAMTGWRLGYAAAEPEIAAAMSDFQSQVTSGPSSISQEAGRAGLGADPADLEEMRLEYDQRRRYVVDRLSSIPGIAVDVVPEGAFYIFPDVSGCLGRTIGDRTVTDAGEFAAVLLERANVAVVPGDAFGAPGRIRISYATSLERLKAGLDRIEQLVGASAG